MSDLADKLRQLDADYEKTEAMAPQGELPPDGNYQAVVDRFDFFTSQKNGRTYLKTYMRVAFGEYRGWSVDTLHDLEDPDRFAWLKGHLMALGVNCKLSELEAHLNEVVDVPVEVRVSTSSNTDAQGNFYRNVYVNKRLGSKLPQADKLPASTDHPSDATDEDDIPFAFEVIPEFNQLKSRPYAR